MQHITAVMVARKNKMDLALGVAVGSSIQIAMFALPLMVVLGWVMGRPFGFAFDSFGSISLIVAVLHAALVTGDANSTWCVPRKRKAWARVARDVAPGCRHCRHCRRRWCVLLVRLQTAMRVRGGEQLLWWSWVPRSACAPGRAQEVNWLPALKSVLCAVLTQAVCCSAPHRPLAAVCMANRGSSATQPTSTAGQAGVPLLHLEAHMVQYAQGVSRQMLARGSVSVMVGNMSCSVWQAV
jgi:hypothetical protein